MAQLTDKDIPKNGGLAIKLLLIAVGALSSVVVYQDNQNGKLADKIERCTENCDKEKQRLVEVERLRTYEAKRLADSAYSADQKTIQSLYRERIEAIDKQNSKIKRARQ
jgi:hypothetical protein